MRMTQKSSQVYEALGYQATSDINVADVILINTCAIRENAENKVFSEIGNLKHLKKRTSRHIDWRLWMYVTRRISCE